MVRSVNRRQLCRVLAHAALAAAAGAGGVAAVAAASAATAAAPAAAATSGTALTAATGEGARWRPWPPGRATPGLELPDLEGVPWSLAQEPGRPVLLNFWASWCAPCRAEMPSLALLQSRFATSPLPASRLQVVTVNFREGREGVRHFREGQDASLMSLRWLRDSYGDVARAWGVRSFPTTFVINAAGQVLLSVEGGLDWSSPAVQQRLQALL